MPIWYNNHLGHRITSQGAFPLQAKVKPIQAFPLPKTVKGLQQFAGMMNFYHRFVSKAAHIMRPIYDALAGKPTNLEWTEELQHPFTATKEALGHVTMLAHPQAVAPTALTGDVSGPAVRAVLEQYLGSWKPLVCFIRKLRPPEQKYSAFDRELLAAYRAIRHFRYFLEGCSFTLYTDHNPLTFAIFKASDPWSPRQQRHLAYISEFTTDVRHIDGKSDCFVDTLSRAAISAMTSHIPDVDFNAMAAAQRADEGIASFRSIAITGLDLLHITLGIGRNTICCDVSTGRLRPLVPDTWQRIVFDAIHVLSRPAIRATKKLVADKFVLPGLNKQVGIWAKTCLRCQAAKVN